MSRTDESIIVNCPAMTAYQGWSDWENFPTFMDEVDSVERIGPSTFRWEAEFSGAHREWIAEVTQMIPGERIAWTTSAGDVSHQGAVHFTALDDDRCEVKAQMVFDPQTFTESVADTLGMVARRVRKNLEAFKDMMESASVGGRGHQ